MATKIPHYCVVGGGISGLSTAYLISLLKSKGSYRLTLLESSPRFGGWINSLKNPNTGAIYELGPHSAKLSSASGNLLLRMVATLGLQDSLVWIKPKTNASKRFLYVNGRIVPLSFFDIGSVFSKSFYLLILKKMFALRPEKQSDLSVDEFFRTRLNDEVADLLASAAIRGIFAGDSRELSVRACMPRVIEAEERGPNFVLGVIRTMLGKTHQTSSIPGQLDFILPSLHSLRMDKSLGWSLQGGMQTLTDALADDLLHQAPYVSLLTNASVSKLDIFDSKFAVQWKDNKGDKKILNDIDSVFLCCPSYRAADILDGLIDREITNRLRLDQLPWANVVVGVLELDGGCGLPASRGFGHLVPRTEDAHVLGVVYDSVVLPHLDSPTGSVRYTVMMKPRVDWFELSSSAFTELVTAECFRVVREHLRLSNPRLIGSHVVLLHNCIPQYPLHHVDRIKTTRAEIVNCLQGRSLSSPGIHLVGFSYDGVGVSDAVASAVNAVTNELKL